MGRIWRVQAGLQTTIQRPRLSWKRYVGKQDPCASSFEKHREQLRPSTFRDKHDTTVPRNSLAVDTPVHSRFNACRAYARAQVILKGGQLLQFHMARDGVDAALQYPTRYLAADNFTMEVDIRLNRYIAQTQASRYAHGYRYAKGDGFAACAHRLSCVIIHTLRERES